MSYKINSEDLRKARAVCPACGKKGVGYSPHPHAFGYKSYDSCQCRYCRARFKIKPKIEKEDSR